MQCPIPPTDHGAAYGRRMRRGARVLALALAAIVWPAHGSAVDGPCTPGVSDALSSLAARFGPVQVAPEMTVARDTLVGGLLAPRKVFEDPKIWSRSSPDERILIYEGHPRRNAYTMALARTAPPLSAPGDWRRVVRLRRVKDGTFEWATRDELCLGSASHGEVLAALGRLVAALDGSRRSAHADQLPRTEAVLSGFLRASDDAARGLAGRPRPDTAFEIDPGGLEPRFPRLARFLREELLPLELQIEAFDQESESLLSLRCLRGLVSVSSAGRDHGQPGDEWRQPVVLVVALTRPVSLFRVGFRQLVGRGSMAGGVDAIALAASFQSVPQWQLPFLVKPFLRSPLGRPFQGDGTQIFLGLERVAGDKLVLTWDYRLQVRESRIVRWLGGLGGGTTGSFHDRAEPEARRLVGSILFALRDDLCQAD